MGEQLHRRSTYKAREQREAPLLGISSNKLTGPLPSDLCKGNNLQTLITLSNFLFGPIPKTIGECSSLSRVRMGGNYLNGSIPSDLFGLPNLAQVELQDMLLNGGFPVVDVASTIALGQISHSNNKLSGSLPPSIGSFFGIQKLLPDGNLFTGELPPELGKLQQLSKMDLSSNGFVGSLPLELSRCKLLTFMDLSRNELSGEIPAEITIMRILNYLNLSCNHLSGRIPSEISTMQSLRPVDFSYNNLSSVVSAMVKFRYFNSTSFLGNPNLYGPYLSSCLSGFASGGDLQEKTHGKGHLTASFKLLLVLGLLLRSIAFAVAAMFKMHALKRCSGGTRSWKLTAFHRMRGSRPSPCWGSRWKSHNT